MNHLCHVIRHKFRIKFVRETWTSPHGVNKLTPVYPAHRSGWGFFLKWRHSKIAGGNVQSSNQIRLFRRVINAELLTLSYNYVTQCLYLQSNLRDAAMNERGWPP